METKAIPIVVTDETFEQTIEHGVTLVDFTTDNCVPCRAQEPILDKVAERMGTEAVMAVLDVRKSPNTASRYGVRKVPSFIIFKNGTPLHGLSGVMREAHLISAVAYSLSE